MLIWDTLGQSDRIPRNYYISIETLEAAAVLTMATVVAEAGAWPDAEPNTPARIGPGSPLDSCHDTRHENLRDAPLELS